MLPGLSHDAFICLLVDIVEFINVCEKSMVP